MCDDERIRRHFRRSLTTYDANAAVQRGMAETLAALLPAREYAAILEIGCGTGQLTRLLAGRFSCREYLANDLVPECAAHLAGILPEARFLAGNIDGVAPQLAHTRAGTFDLIISNACLQWSRRLPETLHALRDCLTSGGVLAFSLFGQDNLREIRALFGAGLPTLTREALCALLPAGTVLTVHEEHCTLPFPSLLDALRHLKRTGVNAFGSAALSRQTLRALEARFRTDYARTLTYHPVYIVMQR